MASHYEHQRLVRIADVHDTVTVSGLVDPGYARRLGGIASTVAGAQILTAARHNCAPVLADRMYPNSVARFAANTTTPPHTITRL